MFRKLLFAGTSLAFLAAMLTFATASQWKTADALTNCSANSGGWNAAENELLVLVNNFRQQNGLGPLTQSPTLANMAAWMAEDMAAHNGPANAQHGDSLGRDFQTRTANCGATGYTGENLGWGFGSAQAMFNGWLNSPGHKAAMINASFKYIGLGQVGSYWAADFSSSPGSSGGTGGTNPTNTPFPTQPSNGNPTNTPANTPTGNGTPTASATTTTSAGGATPIPSYKLPSSYPIKRAMVPQLAAE